MRDGAEAIDEFFGLHVHLLQHRQHDVAQARFFVLRLAAQFAPLVVVAFVLIALRMVVVDMLPVLQAQAAPAGQNDRQIAVGVGAAS